MKTITMVTIDSNKIEDYVRESGDSKSEISTCVLNKSSSYLYTCIKKSKMNYTDYKTLCDYLNIDESYCKIAIEEVSIPDKLINSGQKSNKSKKTKKYDKNVNIDGLKLKESLKTNIDMTLIDLSKSLKKNPNYLNQCIYKNTISEKVLRKLCKQLNVSTREFKVKQPIKKEDIQVKQNTDPVKQNTDFDISTNIKEIYELIDKTKQYKKQYTDSLIKTKTLIAELNTKSNINLSELIEDL